MSRLLKWIAPATAVALGVGIALASGAIGVYGLIDKVIFEPNTNRPERIQIWGVFVFPTPGSPNSFSAPQRGYLYYKRGDDDLPALLEWANLRSQAGAHQVVGFTEVPAPQLRKPDQRPENPDAYRRGIGVSTLRSDTDFPPIKALLEFH
jgi:hypothetical protein